MILPSILYGSEVWWTNKSQLLALERIQLKVGKWILGCCDKTTNEVILGELGFETLKFEIVHKHSNGTFFERLFRNYLWLNKFKLSVAHYENWCWDELNEKSKCDLHQKIQLDDKANAKSIKKGIQLDDKANAKSIKKGVLKRYVNKLTTSKFKLASGTRDQN
eukprot:Awhi_evm1s337